MEKVDALQLTNMTCHLVVVVIVGKQKSLTYIRNSWQMEVSFHSNSKWKYQTQEGVI